MEWRYKTAAELSALDRSIPVVLPIAAVEQHGPHLPVAADLMIAEHFCRAVEAELGDGVLLLPPVAVACSRHHVDFGGTLTVSHSTFTSYVSEILDSVVAAGFGTLVILNSHGGNQAVGQTIVESWGMSHPACRIGLLTWWKVAGDALMEITETGPGGVGHAGEFETSLMLAIDPELVRLDRIEKGGNLATFSWAESDMLRRSKGLLHRPVREMTSNGVFGDPTAASAEKGRRITEVVVKELAEILTDLRRG